MSHCGHLPLALAATGAMIRAGTFSWSDALRGLEEGASEEIDTSWLPDPEQRTLAVVLRTSVDHLQPMHRDCFLACAAFHRGVDIPERALLTVWSRVVPNERVGKTVADELVSRSLMNRDENRRYRIHDLYFDFLRHTATPIGSYHAKLIDCYRATCRNGWESCPDDGYIFHYLLWHLCEGGQINELRQLLFSFEWLIKKIRVAGVDRLISDYALLPDDREVSHVAAAISLSAHVLGAEPSHLGAQLTGRLSRGDGQSISRLLAGATRAAAFAPMRDLYLTPPGSELRRFRGHQARITQIVLLPDGNRVLSASDDCTVRLWNIKNGTEIHCFRRHRSCVGRISLLPSGNCCVSGDSEGGLYLLYLETGDEERFSYWQHKTPIWRLTPLRDASGFLSQSSDQTILWDIKVRCEVRRFGEINSKRCFSDGRLFLFPSSDDTLCLWNLETDSELSRLVGHTKPVTSAALLPDGRHALSQSEDGTTRLWDIESGAELRRFRSRTKSDMTAPPNDYTRSRFSSSLKRFVCLFKGGKRNCIAPMSGSGLRGVLPDGRSALFEESGELVVWDFVDGTELQRLRVPKTSLSWVTPSDGRRALSLDDTGGILRLWDLQKGSEIGRFHEHIGIAHTATILSNGSRALSGDDSIMRLWDLDFGTTQRNYSRRAQEPDHSGPVTRLTPVTRLALLRDGRRALSSSTDWDRTVRLWDVRTGMALRRFEQRENSLGRSIALLPDGRRVISSTGSSVIIWRVENGSKVWSVERYGVNEVAVFPDGHRALVSYSYRLGVLHLKTGDETSFKTGHRENILSISLLPDGRRAISGSVDQTMRLWDISTGTELKSYVHDERVFVVRPMSAGHHALAGLADGTIHLWDLEAGSEVGCLRGHVGEINDIALLHCGRRAVSASADGTLRLWDVYLGIELACYSGDASFTAVSPIPFRDEVLTGNAIGQVVPFLVPKHHLPGRST
jgi:WD40 repeat protein